MLQRILAATDFSSPGHEAVMRGALLARQLGAELFILHVLPERTLFDRVFYRREIDHSAIAAGAERALQAEADAVRDRFGIAAMPAVLDGVAHRAISAAGPAFKADLVVVGALGEGDAASGMRTLGGTALKLLTRTTLPLLLVKGPVEGRYFKVLAAVDGSPHSRVVLAWALELSKDGATCQVLYAFEVPFAERLRAQGVLDETLDAYASEEHERWQKQLAELTAQLSATDRVTPVVVRGSPAATVMREILSRRPDVVVLGRRRHRNRDTDPHSVGSVSLRIAYDAPADVLIIP